MLNDSALPSHTAVTSQVTPQFKQKSGRKEAIWNDSERYAKEYHHWSFKLE